MSLEAIATKLGVAALTKLVTHSTQKLLEKNWNKGTDSSSELIRQLSQDHVAKAYAEKYVARCLKMRTLHNPESDVYLDEIYSPLTLSVVSNNDKLYIDDGFTLSFSKVINIIGFAGQGKSTILRKLFLEELKKGERFPFLIELRHIENITIIDYLKSIFKDIGLYVNNENVEFLLQSKKIILMLDGFDEVSTNNRIKILHEIIQLNTRLNSDVIVTSRPDTEICNQVNITNLKVENLNESDIISILDKLDKYNSLSELPTLISKNTALQETLTTPILVNLLFFCYPYLDVVPENVTDFYDRLFFTLYSRHDKIKNFNREKSSGISAVQGNKIFNALCFDTINKEVFDFTETTLPLYFEKALKINYINDVDIEKIQHDLVNITCLLQKDGFDKYVFLHKSVQEFHAARFISSLPHNHKENFYKKISSIIDEQDKFDNILNFLRHIDKDDYESILIINYFESNKLHYLNSENQEEILEKHIKKY